MVLNYQMYKSFTTALLLATHQAIAREIRSATPQTDPASEAIQQIDDIIEGVAPGSDPWDPETPPRQSGLDAA